MQSKGIRAGDLPTAVDDLRDQRVVLTHVLALHPAHQTIPELAHELAGGSADFAEGDAVERAVRDLTGAGLLHCPSGIVLPSRAALHFDRLSNV